MRQIDKFILHVTHNLFPLNEYSEGELKRLMDQFREEADDLGIQITDEQLKAYIERFDILKNSPKITEKDLRKYSLSQLIKLVTASKGGEAPEAIDITPDVVYHNDDNTIVVYNGSKEGNCINYGSGERWCITKGSFGNYRYDQNRRYPTFYLIRNTNLDDNDPLSFVAVQVRNTIVNNDRYVYTNRLNNPYESKPMNFEQLVSEIPWLNDIPNLKSILKYIPLSSSELANQQYSKNATSIREWIKLPYSVKEQYLVVRKGDKLFSDISNDEFVQKYLPKYSQLATFVARNADIINSVTLLKNLEYFSPADRKSVTENLRVPIDIKYLATDSIPFDVKKLLVRLNKWEVPADQRLYITKDGQTIVRLTLGDNIQLGLYTEEDDFPNAKVNKRTAKYVAEYPDLDKIPVRNLLKLVEDGIIDQQILDQILVKAKNDPNSALILRNTDEGQILVDTNSFTAYKLEGNSVTKIPFDDENVTKILSDEKDNTSLQDNALGLFKSYRNIPDTIEKEGLQSVINNIPYDKRILNMGAVINSDIPLILLPTTFNAYPFVYMAANPNDDNSKPANRVYLSYGGTNWREPRSTSYSRDAEEEILNSYFAYLRNENITLSDQALLRVFKGGGYLSDYERQAKVAFTEANPPTSTENQYAPIMYDGTAYLINKTNPRESFKVSNTGRMVKANVSPTAARQLIGTAATPEPAVAQGAGDREEAPLRRRGRPAGGGAPRAQGQAGDVSVEGVLQAAGLNGAFQLLPRNDYRRLNVTDARVIPVANDRGASRRNNILGDAGRVTNAFATPGGSAVYIIRLNREGNIVASIVAQPGNRHYILIDNNGFRSAVPLNSPRELRQALQQRGLAENIKKMAAKFYLAENPSMLDETVNMLKKLKEIKIQPKIPQQYEAVKFETNPYINLDVSFLENYIDEFLEEPYEYENDLQYFIYDIINDEPIDTNTITLPNFVNYLVDGNYESWFNNDFKEIKYILSLKDVSSINEYVDKKAKELSKNNPEDFKFYQDEIKDVVSKLKEQLPLFLKTTELLKGKYTVLSSFLDYFNSLYSIFVFSDGNDLRYIAIDKNLGYFDNNGNLQVKKEVYDKIYKEEDFELDEIKIYPTPNIDLTRAKNIIRRYIGQDSDYFQYNNLYDVIDLGSYYTIRPYGGDEDNFYLLLNKELFDDNFDTNSDGKLDTMYSPKKLTKSAIEDLQQFIKNKQPKYINEIKISPLPLGNWSEIPAPALYNFVKTNYKALLAAIKEDIDKNYPDPDAEDEFTFKTRTGIKDINNVKIDPQNYWEYLDEDGEYPNGQEVAITDPEAGECEGLYISNMDDYKHDDMGSGMSFEPIPGFPGLYYDIMWC